MKENKNLLKNILFRENNNFDLIRLFAACLVIYGHANAMIPASFHRSDHIAEFLKFDYSGALAIKIFFFLSGLVVANSLLEKKSVLQFIVARFFRIWPALLFVLFFTTVIIGSYFTTLSLRSYFTHPEAFGYIYKNSLMDIVFELPGVFQGPDSINHRSVNGSIWSLPYELGCYIVLLALFVLGLHKYKKLSVFIVFVLFLDVILGNKIIFSWRPLNASIDDLSPFFAFGALLALFKDKITVDFKMIFALFIICLVFKNAPYFKFLFYIFLFLLLLYVFSRVFFIKIKMSLDISYGVYIWGWPVQQVLAHEFPQLSYYQHVFTAILIACALGTFSWFLIEKPGIRFGVIIYKSLSNRFTKKNLANSNSNSTVCLGNVGGPANSESKA